MGALGLLMALALIYMLWDMLSSNESPTRKRRSSTQKRQYGSEKDENGNEKDEKGLDTYSNGLKKFVCRLCSREKIVEPEVNTVECTMCGRKMVLKERFMNDSEYVGKFSNVEDIISSSKIEENLLKEIRYRRDIIVKSDNEDDGEVKTSPKISCNDKKDILEESYKRFQRIFNEENVEYPKEEGECYTLPYVAFLEKDQVGWFDGYWESRKSLCIGKSIDILNISYRLGKKASVSDPKAFVLAIDNELWEGKSRKFIFRSSILNEEGSLRSASVIEKEGSAHLPYGNGTSAMSKENDITLSAANAFWIGAGMNAQHDGPQVEVKLGSEAINLGTRGFSPELGSVYVLVNSEIYNVVKIGYTEDSARKRARQLSGTGVPGEWNVAHEIKTHYPERLEERAHRKLSDQRVQDNREFFRVEPEEAARVIKKVRG